MRFLDICLFKSISNGHSRIRHAILHISTYFGRITNAIRVATLIFCNTNNSNMKNTLYRTFCTDFESPLKKIGFQVVSDFKNISGHWICYSAKVCRNM